MKKVYLEFSNKGEIDVNALRLLGASTKETDDSKIGFWGTGLKYAIAVLLRDNIEVKVFSGEKEIKISKRKTKMRGEPFEVMTVNGTPTSVTTRMGKDWKTWYAVRELFANMKDEGNEKIEVIDQPKGKKGHTRIFVEFDEQLKDVFDNLNKYFSFNREAKYELGLDKLYPRFSKQKGILYRRGFAIGSEYGLLFDYDLHDIEINETRTVKYNYQVAEHIGRAMRRYAPLEVIRRIVNTQCYERDDLDWEYSSDIPFNNDWLKALGGTVIVPREAAGFYADDLSKAHHLLPSELCKQLDKYFGDKLIIRGYNNSHQVLMKEVSPTSIEKQAIQKAVTKMCSLFPDAQDIEIVLAEMKDKDVMGTVSKDGKIIINRNVINRGEHDILTTIIEEYIHIKSGAEDRTREFQDYAVDCIATAVNRIAN